MIVGVLCEYRSSSNQQNIGLTSLFFRSCYEHFLHSLKLKIQKRKWRNTRIWVKKKFQNHYSGYAHLEIFYKWGSENTTSVGKSSQQNKSPYITKFWSHVCCSWDDKTKIFVSIFPFFYRPPRKCLRMDGDKNWSQTTSTYRKCKICPFFFPNKRRNFKNFETNGIKNSGLYSEKFINFPFYVKRKKIHIHRKVATHFEFESSMRALIFIFVCRDG